MNKRNAFMSTQFETREEQETGNLILSGYFIRFNEETELWPGYFEMVERKGVEAAIKDADIRALFNHNDSIVLGRTGNGTLTLSVDDTGLKGDIIINPKDPEAIGAYARVERGDVVGCSFGFIPLEIDQRKDDEGNYHDIIKALEIFEVSPCTFPAYPQTEIAARRKEFDKAKHDLAERKRKIKEKYHE